MTKPHSHLILQDKILGEKKTRRKIKEFGKNILIPSLQCKTFKNLQVRDVDIYYVMPDFHYFRRLDFLKLLDENLISYYLKISSTKYFHTGNNIIHSYFRAYRYRRLYSSLKKNGIKYNLDDIWTLPWLFASAECILRLDGSHRASIARYLGYKTIKVFLLTPKFILSNFKLKVDDEKFFMSLAEPEIDLICHKPS